MEATMVQYNDPSAPVTRRNLLKGAVAVTASGPAILPSGKAAAAEAVPISIEFSLGELKDRSKARRQQTLLQAAPLIQAHYIKLSKMSQRGLEDVSDGVRKDALSLYNKAVTDGRYVQQLKTNPRLVAEKLGMRVGPEAIGAIGKVTDRISGENEGPVEAVIAVAVVIVLAPKIPAEGIVIDELATLRTRL
jgi:hypothetical protein